MPILQKQGHVIKEGRERICEEQERQGENKLPKEETQKHIHFAHTAKELTTQQTFAGVPRMQQIDPKDKETEDPYCSTDENQKPGTSKQNASTSILKYLSN